MENIGTEKALFGLVQKIPDGEKALVTGIAGRVREILGPKIVSPFASLRFFERIEVEPGNKVIIYSVGEEDKREVIGPKVEFIHPDGALEHYERQVIEEGSKGLLFDEDGKYEEVEGPKSIYIHPNGRYIPFVKIVISEREAIVSIDEQGKETIIEGKKQPINYIHPIKERLKSFRWTGSAAGPDSEKKPGALNFQILRLDDSQTYFSFPVRTKDNALVIVRLMVFYGISSLEKIVKESHDPFCEFYNKLQAEVTKKIATLSFDDFKKDTGSHIEKLETMKGKQAFEHIGLRIDSIVLREWEPADKKVQQVLEQAAIVQTQKALDTAEHERRMAKIGNEKIEREEEGGLNELRRQGAIQEGKLEGEKLSATMKELKEIAGGAKEAAVIMKILIATRAATLHIDAEILK